MQEKNSFYNVFLSFVFAPERRFRSGNVVEGTIAILGIGKRRMKGRFGGKDRVTKCVGSECGKTQFVGRICHNVRVIV
jgi:hypothetical protein